MKRPNRALEIFSISALDLFASALGAFILVAVILFPYYLKNWEVVADNEKLKDSLSAAQAQLAQAQAEAQASKEAAQAAEARAKSAEAQAKSAEAQARSAQAAAASARSQAPSPKPKAAPRTAKVSTVFALLGITTEAKSFVILVDMSQSMRAYTNLMVDTMRRLLKPMEGNIRLTIIGFNAPGGFTRLHPWTRNGQLVAMTAQGKQRAMAFVRQLSAGFAGKTPTHAALREALRYPVESVILLSDGSPTDNRDAAIVADITGANRGRKEINCVAIGDYNKHPRLVSFLQALARRNRGDFTGVAG